MNIAEFSGDFDKSEISRRMMGGSGSTRWSGHERRRTIGDSEHLILSAKNLAAFGNVPDGTTARAGWGKGSPEMILTLRIRPSGTRSVEFALANGRRLGAVSLVDNPMRFGGLRYWLLCPGCGKKNSKLFMHRVARWRCRDCAGFGYTSRRLSPMSRLQYRAERIARELLGAEEWEFDMDDPPRPRGMHASTYQDLIDRLNKVRKSYDDLWCVEFGREYQRLEQRVVGSR